MRGDVLGLFEAVRPDDDRPGAAIEAARAWTPRGDGDDAGPSSRWPRDGRGQDLRGAARYAAYAAGQAGAVAHVAAVQLGAAAYAIEAVRAATPGAGSDAAGLAECRWQRGQLSGSRDDQVTRSRSVLPRGGR